MNAINLFFNGSPGAAGTKVPQRIGERILDKLFNCQFVADFAVGFKENGKAQEIVRPKCMNAINFNDFSLE